MKKWLWVILNLFVINLSHAQQPLTVLQRNAEQNELKILDNRFRIDYKVDEITLVFFRKQGSPAIILVRPDGSKLNVINTLNNDNIDWGDGATYDIIKIKRPMPGPWQAIGDILPESKIMVLSDIELHVDPLPPLLFKGEIIKLTARLTNGGQPIEENLFRDVVALEVDFTSTNNENAPNFNAKPVSVTEFLDNGQGYDEVPADGVFTGEYELNFAAGQWQPEYQVSTPILTRRVIKPAVIVELIPLEFSFNQAQEDQQEHTLVFYADPKKLKINSLIYQGVINYPNGEREKFNLPQTNKVSRSLPLTNYDWGIYELEMTVFGTNINGREFVAKLDKQEFEIKRVIDKTTMNQPEVVEKPLLVSPIIKALPEPKNKAFLSQEVLIWTIIANLLIVIVGLLVVRVFIQKKSFLSGKLGYFLNWRKRYKEQKSTESEYKTDSLDEILNLSLPDE